ncbi:MAG: DNA adenine methylase, partial [Steroidobacteraceae bacterium]
MGRNSDFRPIHYLGCKTSLTAAIKGAIDELDPRGGRLCDLFAGTGAVAGALGAEREVTTVDVQEYSRVLCSAVLAPPRLSTPEILRLTASIAHRHVARQTVACMQPLIDYETECIAAATRGDREPLAELLESPSLAAYDEPCFEAPAGRLAGAMLEV